MSGCNNNQNGQEIFSQEDLLLFNSEDNKYFRSLVSCDSQELIDLKDDTAFLTSEFVTGAIKREVSIPLSPPNTPKSISPDSNTSSTQQPTSPPQVSYLIPKHLCSQSKAGRYNFQLYFKEETKFPSKSCLHTYSKQLKKLFVQKDHDIPFTFQTSVPLPNHFEIRSYLCFEDVTYKSHTVEKCPNDKKTWEGQKAEDHIIINKREETYYSRCPSGPYVTITPGCRLDTNKCEFSDAYIFACYTTCRGGINRRRVSILFALYTNDTFCGQAKVEISICSSPGRDRKNKENAEKCLKIKTESPTTPPLSSTTTTTETTNPATDDMLSAKTTSVKRKSEDTNECMDAVPNSTKKFFKIESTTDRVDNSNDIFYIRVCGRERFHFLNSVNEAFETSDRFYRMTNHIQPFDNGLILNKQGFQQFKNFNPAVRNPKHEDKNKVYKQNLERFDDIKRKVKVTSLKLERSQSDPTSEIPLGHRKTSLIFPWEMFHKERKLRR